MKMKKYIKKCLVCNNNTVTEHKNMADNNIVFCCKDHNVLYGKITKSTKNNIENRDFSCIYNMTHDGAYILGCIWKNAITIGDRIKISCGLHYIDVLKRISIILYNKNKVKLYDDDGCYLIIDDDIVNFIYNISRANDKTEWFTKLPSIDDEFMMSFICGYFDSMPSSIYYDKIEFCLGVLSPHLILQEIADVLNVDYINKPYLILKGYHALDIIGSMYENVSIFDHTRYKDYIECLNNLDSKKYSNFNIIKVCKITDDAILPSKKHVTDSGYDIWLISAEKINNTLYMCDTGISVTPPFGYYMDVMSRSSLAKHGLHFVGAIGVIDRSYTGSIKILLELYDSTKQFPDLPFKAVQMIPREIKHFDLVETKNLENTVRGSGGFGSTDDK